MSEIKSASPSIYSVRFMQVEPTCLGNTAPARRGRVIKEIESAMMEVLVANKSTTGVFHNERGRGGCLQGQEHSKHLANYPKSLNGETRVIMEHTG